MLVLPDQFDSDSTTMSETTNSLWITICCSIAIQACISACYKYIDTNYGKDWRIHVAYLAVAICSVALIPVNVASYIFTSLTVSFVGYVVMNRFYVLFCLIVIPCVMLYPSSKMHNNPRFEDAFILFTEPRRQYVHQMTRTTRNGYNIG